jgi:hypothetical protein
MVIPGFRVIDDLLFQHFDQRCNETVVDAVLDDQAGRCRTTLAGGEKRAIQDGPHRSVEVRIGKNNQRILATHLQLNFGSPARSRFQDASTGVYRSRESDRGNIRILYDCVSND